MAFNQKIQDAFNEQMNREFYSSNLYLAMAAHCNSEDLRGLSNWLGIQAEEERAHAMKFYNFILSRGGRVKIGEHPQPPNNWKSPLNVFEEVLKHEQLVTGYIHELLDLTQAERDHAASSFLQFFVDEQVEEEDSASEIVGRLKIGGDHGASLFMIDSELGQRTATPTV